MRKPSEGSYRAGIPTERCRHRAGIRSGEVAERKTIASVVAVARCDRGHQRMDQTVANTGAIATIVDCVFAEDLRHQVAGGRCGDVDSVVAARNAGSRAPAPPPHSGGVPDPVPVDSVARSLVDAGRNGASEKRVRAERVEQIALKLLAVRRLLIRLSGLRVRGSRRLGVRSRRG